MPFIELPGFYDAHLKEHRDLTAKEEYDLGTIIQSRKELPPDPLSDDQKQIFARQLIEIQRALDYLVEANLRRVLKMVGDFKIRNSYLSADDLDELVQTGNMALRRAAGRYDPLKGRFSTYATKGIRRNFNKYIARFRRVVALPAHFRRINNIINDIQEGYLQRDGEPPTREEIASQLSRRLGANYTPGRVSKYMAYSARREISLCTREGDDNYKEPIFLSDTRFKDPLEGAMDHDTGEFIRNCLDKLPSRDRLVLIKRFGFDGTPGKTLEEVAELIHCSSERVRQIEVKALRKMEKYIMDSTKKAAPGVKEDYQLLPRAQNPSLSDPLRNALSESAAPYYMKGRYQGGVPSFQQPPQPYSQSLTNP